MDLVLRFFCFGCGVIRYGDFVTFDVNKAVCKEKSRRGIPGNARELIYVQQFRPQKVQKINRIPAPHQPEHQSLPPHCQTPAG
jgi:hypothetical protein